MTLIIIRLFLTGHITYCQKIRYFAPKYIGTVQKNAKVNSKQIYIIIFECSFLYKCVLLTYCKTCKVFLKFLEKYLF